MPLHPRHPLLSDVGSILPGRHANHELPPRALLRFRNTGPKQRKRLFRDPTRLPLPAFDPNCTKYGATVAPSAVGGRPMPQDLTWGI